MNIQILGIASDIAGGRLGQARGVEILCDYVRESKIALLDENNYLSPAHKNLDTTNSKAKNIAHLYDFYSQRVSKCMESILQKGDFALILSGDHSSALASVQGLQNAMPNETVGIVWIDAHADIHTPFTSPSGNMHGMPLGALIGAGGSSDEVSDIESNYWDKLSSISKDSINPSHIVYCGLRSFEEGERRVIESNNIPVYSVENIMDNMQKCVDSILENLNSCTKIYISLDIDVLDSGVFQSTGCNVENGLSITSLKELMSSLFRAFGDRIAALEFSEFNPALPYSTPKDTQVMKDLLAFSIESIKTLHSLN